MVLRFASQKLLNLYFKCLVFHLIKYIKKIKSLMKNTECVPFLCKNKVPECALVTFFHLIPVLSAVWF